MQKPISAEFPFKSKFIDIDGSKMHYIDEGEGDVILFLHGNPTSSYLWRNIIPHLQTNARCLAVDLIGMGKSDKPGIGYSFFDHSRYLWAFIEKLALKNITLVIHDWGSALGFHYANNHRENIRAIAFMEAVVKTAKWDEMRKSTRSVFKLMRTPILGYFMLQVRNMFITKLLPNTIIRELTAEEQMNYAAPFQSISDRKPLRQWPLNAPISDHPKAVCDAVDSYVEYLTTSEIPKLCIYAKPGLLIPKKLVAWVAETFNNIETVSVGEGIHFIQEDEPVLIGEALAKWYAGLPINSTISL